MRFPSDAQVFAAARQLHDHDLQKIGHFREMPTPVYDALDPIGKDEFDVITERILMAAEEGGTEAAARRLYGEGEFHGWWGNPAREWDPQGYDKMDSAEREEFERATERLVKAAADARENP